MVSSSRALFRGRFGGLLRPAAVRWNSGGTSSPGDLVEVQARPPATTVPPMNTAVFRSVFSTASRDRYKHLYRWDWHLRKLIYALIPPGAAYAYVCFLEWYMADEVAAFREMVTAEKAAKDVDGVKQDAKSLEQRVLQIEAYMLLLEEKRQRDDVVDRAKLVLKQQRHADARELKPN